MLVYYVCLYFLTKLGSTSGQFKEHIDLQKIAEIMFQNEKYNVLKPTVHMIKDHFVEFIQKRDNRDPSERMFLDGNGLRHIWRGLELPNVKSFRKADTLQKAIDVRNVNENSSLINNSTTLNVKSIVDTNMNLQEENTKNLTEAKQSQRDTATSLPEPELIKPNLRNGTTVVKTTFFCPFFGVVRMTTHVHNFNETGNITRR